LTFKYQMKRHRANARGISLPTITDQTMVKYGRAKSKLAKYYIDHEISL
jgi:hypothetical protein